MALPFNVIDLTHTLTPNIPSWNGRCGFSHEIKSDYGAAETTAKFRVQQIKMHAGIGTHVDAPAHCIPGGKNIAELELTQLIAPCVMIDVSVQAHPSYSVTVADLHEFEARCGVIPPDCFVIVYTGWEQFWGQPERYRNDYQFPNISREAIAWLLSRNIVGVGIDTLSPDRPSEGFPVHELVLGAGKYIVENVAHAAKLPPMGAYTFALPIKTQEGAEAPMRLIGMWT